MNYLRKLLILFILIFNFIYCEAYITPDSSDIAIKNEIFSYKPDINGTIRAKFEYEPQISSYRFQVRNARVSLKGWVYPTIDYKIEVDFCDQGDLKVLDVYGRYNLKKIGTFTLGQMRVPFSVDATRSPHLLFFANRSFIAKEVGNVRDVGFKATYTPQNIPLIIEGGIFNGNGLKGQKKWNKNISISGKANYTINNVKFEIGGQSIIPDSIRINLFDTSLSWCNDRFFIEGEYLYKHYGKNSFPDVHSYNLMINYELPLRKFFYSITFGGRFDGMGDHSEGIRNSEGLLTIDDYGRKRLTGGVTLSFLKKFRADLRLNYEKYFYDDNAIIKESAQDKIVLELMVRF